MSARENADVPLEVSELVTSLTAHEPLRRPQSANDLAARLAELISDDPGLKEAPLRRDVRSLGRILGDVMQEQEGAGFLAAVEDIRRATIQRIIADSAR